MTVSHLENRFVLKTTCTAAFNSNCTLLPRGYSKINKFLMTILVELLYDGYNRFGDVFTISSMTVVEHRYCCSTPPYTSHMYKTFQMDQSVLYRASAKKIYSPKNDNKIMAALTAV